VTQPRPYISQQIRRVTLEWFRQCAEAKVIIEAWRQHYNDDHNTHPSMWLKRRGFADRDAISRGVWDSSARAP
jgi:hypothetical protein